MSASILGPAGEFEEAERDGEARRLLDGEPAPAAEEAQRQRPPVDDLPFEACSTHVARGDVRDLVGDRPAAPTRRPPPG